MMNTNTYFSFNHMYLPNSISYESLSSLSCESKGSLTPSQSQSQSPSSTPKKSFRDSGTMNQCSRCGQCYVWCLCNEATKGDTPINNVSKT